MRKNIIAILLILSWIGGALSAAVPAYAAVDDGCTESSASVSGSIAPENGLISSLEDLLQWYNDPSNQNEWPELANDVIVGQSITLAETAEQKDLGAIEHIICVTAGGSLTLDNTKLAVQGPGTVILVEAGGSLSLEHGVIYTAPDSNAIIIEEGGQLIRSAAFIIDVGGVLDKNQAETLPPEPQPEPEPLPSVKAVRPITSIVGFDYSLACLEGEPPDLSEYPAAVRAVYAVSENTYAQLELPVKWELDTVDFETAGTYIVKGVFAEADLTAQQLSNPDNLSAALKLMVQRSGSIENLTGNVLHVGNGGPSLIRLTLPALPSDAAALYVYCSPDGQHWQQAVGQDAQTEYENFLPYAQTQPLYTYVNYRCQADDQPIWLRVEVVGSIYAGESNAICLEMPVSDRPGEVIDTGGTEGDGSSGGNRGGGGQKEAGHSCQRRKHGSSG